MNFDDPDRAAPTGLKGWLSDVYFPALLAGSVEALGRRLGGKATLDDPMFGRATTLSELEVELEKIGRWLGERSASYQRGEFTTGIERDVTEGSLSLTFDSKTVVLPVAVVAEKRRSREVELRIYYCTQPIRGSFSPRRPMLEQGEEVPLPPIVIDHLAALAEGNVDGVLATFEAHGSVREARGIVRAKADATMREFYERLTAPGSAARGVELRRAGAADDGRTCALEYTLVRACGREVPPQAGLIVFERGESGLLRSVRMFDDIDA
jgi:hypothetical protein